MPVHLRGQDKVVRFLRSATTSARLPHALLFLGPPGVGRETAARGLAAGLLCERRVAPFGCGTCRACRRVESGVHPDVHLVVSEAEAARRGLGEPEGKKKASVDIKVDQVRELSRVLRLKAYEGGARVAIVVDAHRMNPSAQNALLKTLEEPAPGTCIVLVAPQARAVLPTIASRCARLTFAPLAEEDVLSILEERGVADARSRARAAGGSVAAAIALDPVEEERARARADELLAALAGGDPMERLDAAEALGKERGDVDVALAAIERALATSIRATIGRASADVDPARATALLEAVGKARQALKENVAVQLALEELFLGAAPSEGPFAKAQSR